MDDNSVKKISMMCLMVNHRWDSDLESLKAHWLLSMMQMHSIVVVNHEMIQENQWYLDVA